MAKDKNTIIGTFDGECADANITNLNGLDITREVWENVFNSDEYKQAIEQGWYIGYLGHPEDPNCMDFEHACIVMTDGYIDDDNKIYGAFNLIDTPVGRVVKSFIDAGVQFGISVRGAGDIENNSVDPDTFVFRGFDLVTFPAYPNSIPEFQEIAASTDLAKRAKYRKVCATIKANVNDLPLSSIDVLQSQFAPQSREYEMLENQRKDLESAEIVDNSEFSDERLNALMQMYLDEKSRNEELEKELESHICANRNLKKKSKKIVAEVKRKTQSFKDIMSSQHEDLLDELDFTISANKKLEHKVISLQSQLKSKMSANDKLRCQLDDAKSDLEDEIYANEQLQSKMQALESKCDNVSDKLKSVKSSMSELKGENQKLIEANAELSAQMDEQDDEADKIYGSNNALKKTNLIYKDKISDLESQIESKDRVIASLRDELAETVDESEDAIKIQTSNLEAQNKILTLDITAAHKLIAEYQQAYAGLYAHAVGIEIDSLDISATASVSELQKSIQNAQIKSSRHIEDEDDVYLDTDSDDGIITI